MGIVECINVSKVYERKEKPVYIEVVEKRKEVIKTVALDNINLEIEDGEFLVVMGPSGSGKSTLMNMISTIDKTTSGSILIDGKNIKSFSETEIAKFRYENLGFIFQNFNVLTNLTVEENIALPLSLNGKSLASEISSRVLEMGKKIGIEKILNKYPNECSGGQIQRIAICRALINTPKILIADEPTGNLDTENSHQILSILKDLNYKEKRTVIMVTHDSMIASYGSRILFLRDGKIENELKRGEKPQGEFFFDIMEYTSKEARELLRK